jgi:integrase
VDLGTAPDGKRRRHYQGGFRTKKSARDAEIALRAKLAGGTFVNRSGVTVSGYFEHWLKVQYDLRPSTLAAYRSNISNHVIPTLGALRLQDLSTSHLNTLYADLLVSGRVKTGEKKGGPLSARTVRHVAVIVRKALQDALKSGLVERNVADAAQKPKQKPLSSSTMVTWSNVEVADFLRATASDRYWSLWVLFLTTGLRRGEALGLRWEDVDFERATASIRRTLLVVNRDAGRDAKPRAD